MARLYPILALLLCAIVANGQPGFDKAIRKHRKAYKRAFLEDARSPLNKAQTKQLSFFPPDEAYRVAAEFSPADGAKPFDMATYSGVTKPYILYGTATFQLKGQALTLEIYQSISLMRMPQYRDYLFLPFKDDTNGELTYGGGRYMDISVKDIEDGKIILDFNKAYNPWCAYSDGYNCPIPPAANHLGLPILAGEKRYAPQ
ncbi:DUF1684 domain-containing protein [Phaeodactylibacter luteus]|uniref:DUF1684 domain-containing protein n=1 Tax=Phaeodactylibacter luteus TaxID=1564516 RepID=A0A5C6RHX1_9BACT|nr:DUF1684 domain-containing protein [Phaeodactylibacter luteus]TXB61549.1 DUF1684 domain-containing protein [Phaeodactylibacter luteus]